MDMTLLLTVNEACDTLRLGRTYLYRLINEGRLKAIKIGSATRITTESVRALAAGDAATPANDDAPAAERGAA